MLYWVFEVFFICIQWLFVWFFRCQWVYCELSYYYINICERNIWKKKCYAYFLPILTSQLCVVEMLSMRIVCVCVCVIFISSKLRRHCSALYICFRRLFSQWTLLTSLLSHTHICICEVGQFSTQIASHTDTHAYFLNAQLHVYEFNFFYFCSYFWAFVICK